jgi:hypothetical protein
MITHADMILAAIIALLLCTSGLLDGPSEIDAIQATAASVDDAITQATQDAQQQAKTAPRPISRAAPVGY